MTRITVESPILYLFTKISEKDQFYQSQTYEWNIDWRRGLALIEYPKAAVCRNPAWQEMSMQMSCF